MVPTGPAKVRGPSAPSKPIYKTVSNDSGVGQCRSNPQDASNEVNQRVRDASGSSRSSDAWSTREVRLSASAASTIGPLFHPTKFDGASTSETTPPPLMPQLAPPVELVDPPYAEQTRRSSRRVQRWLAEQQRLTSGADVSIHERVAKASGTPCNPYLAYPNMPNVSTRTEDNGNEGSLRSFVIVEEDETIINGLSGPGNSYNLESTDIGPSMYESSPPAVPYAASTRSSSLRIPRPMSVLSVSSWRNLPLPKTLSQRSFSTPGEPVDLATPPQTHKKSPLLRRRSPIPETFRDTHEPTIPKNDHRAQSKTSTGTLRAPETPTRNSMRHRLGNFVRAHANAGLIPEWPASAKDAGSPRPSTSTSSATTATSTAVENEVRSETCSSPGRFLPKFAISLSKARRQTPLDLSSPSYSTFSSSTQTFASPLARSQGDDPSYTTPPPLPSLSKKPSQPNIFRDKKRNESSSALSTLSIGSIGSIATSIGGRSSSVFAGSSTVKRKRLVVSGIELDDTSAVQGLRKWCESFGELRQITRMPNGDLHIDFKRADVADTVCRISARVYIAGVGSVNMSWIARRRGV